MIGGNGAWALELLTEQMPHVERGDVRRRFREAAAVWAGGPADQWWRWCLETSSSLGLNLKVVDCTPAEAAELARQGAFLATRLPESGEKAEWIVIFGNSRKRMIAARSSDPETRARHHLRSLRRFVASLSQEPTLRFVVLDPNRHSFDPSLSEKTSKEPLHRLQRLLAAERTDLWIVVVFAFVVGLLTLATPIAVEALVNTVAFGRLLQPVVVLALMLFTFLAFSAAIRALQTYVVEIIQRRLFARVAADLSYRLPRTETEPTEMHYMPELVNRFFDVVTVQKISAQLLLDGVALFLATVIGMTVLAFYHPWLFGFDVLLLVSLVFVIFVLGRGAVPSAIKESKMKYLTASWLEDVARCPVTFHSDGGIDFAMERADHLIKDYLTARQAHFRVLMRQIIFALGIQAVASTVLLGLGGWLVISGELTLGQLVAAELIVTVIVGGFAKLGKHMEGYYDLMASVDKLGVLFDLPHERNDGLLVLGDNSPIAVEVSNATYARSNGIAVVRGLSFSVSPRGSFALIGPAGSGKSTVLDMLYALRNPTSGHLTVNGFDPGDIRPDLLRRHVALVRGVEVFQGTVNENVHLHRPEVSSKQVRDALERVGLLETVLHLEDGLETALASGGAPLSENQCRLLSLARAIAGEPGLLLIDGLLDPLAEEELFALLDFLTQPDAPWTVIIATSRDEVAARCERQHRLPNPLYPLEPQIV
jgi:putative ABC transport system ATP-binding protein